MADIQEIFTRVQENQREVREYNKIKKDMLYSASDYQALIDDLESLKARKKQIEEGVAAQMSGKAQEIERLKYSISEDKQLLADVALKNLMSGQAVRVRGSNDEEYEPQFAVRFKKK